MVVCDTDQPRMWEVKIVEGNQCHGKIVGRRDQFSPECCGEVGLATALRTLHPHDERLIWSNPPLKVFQYMSQHMPDHRFWHSRETRRGSEQDGETWNICASRPIRRDPARIVPRTFPESAARACRANLKAKAKKRCVSVHSNFGAGPTRWIETEVRKTCSADTATHRGGARCDR